MITVIRRSPKSKQATAQRSPDERSDIRVFSLTPHIASLLLMRATMNQEAGDYPWKTLQPGARRNRCSRHTRPTCSSGSLGPPDRPATISDAYDIQERYRRAAARRGWRGRGLQGGADVGDDAEILRHRPSHRRCRAPQAACTGRARRCGVRITGGWGWSSRSRFASSPTCRSPQAGHAPREMIAPHIDGVLRGGGDRRRSQRRLRQSRCAARWWRTIPGMRELCCRNFRRNGPTSEAVRGSATNGGACDRRRLWARYSWPSLQFGGVAGDAARFARRRVEGGPGGDDRERDEDGISGGAPGAYRFGACRDWIGRGAGAVKRRKGLWSILATVTSSRVTSSWRQLRSVALARRPLMRAWSWGAELLRDCGDIVAVAVQRPGS